MGIMSQRSEIESNTEISNLLKRLLIHYQREVQDIKKNFSFHKREH